MALAKKLGGLSRSLYGNKVHLYSATRCYCDDKPLEPWNHLWKPEKYSKENHNKFAEMYNLHPDEYKPYPNNERFLNNYPALPNIGAAAKDPYYPYDFPALKRNYREPLHDNFEIMGEDRIDVGLKEKVTPLRGTIWFLTTMAFFGIMTYLMEPYPRFQPLMEIQYPQKDKIHYTFEPEK